MEVRFRITKKDGTLPDTAKSVAPRNNIIHTLFDKLEMFINDTPITSSAHDYPYKAYFINTLTYDKQVKNSHLQTQGYFPDSGGHFDSLEEAKNAGAFQRSLYFRKDFKKDSEYRSNGASFIGRLYHDLVNCETGLIPNTKVRFLFEKSKNSFVLMSSSTDEEAYQYVLMNMCLYVPVAQLSLPLYNELNLMMAHKDSKPIAIQYRRIEIRPHSIPLNAEEWWTPSLFSEADLPCRIIASFVLSSAKNGDYHSNPFTFNRAWETTTSSGINTSDDSWQVRFSKLEKEFFEFQKKINKTQNLKEKRKKVEKPLPRKSQRNKKRKDATETSDSDSESISEYESDVRQEAEKRIKSYLESLKTNKDTTSSDLLTLPIPSSSSSRSEPSTNVNAPTKKTIYIKKIELYLNQTLIDQLSDDQTEDECINTYFRFFYTNGQANTLFTNAITYDEFRKGYFFVCYDLTTSNKSGTNYVIPSIRVGHLRLR